MRLMRLIQVVSISSYVLWGNQPLGVSLVTTHNFWTSIVLVLNEMVLVLVLDCPSDRGQVLPFGRSAITKNPRELHMECACNFALRFAG